MLKSHFILINDIDLNPSLPGGKLFDESVITGSFTGSLDGNGNVIRNLFIWAPEKDDIGLFDEIGDGGSVYDLGLEGFIIMGRYRTGTLSGEIIGASIFSCYSTGCILYASDTVGGLVGFSNGGNIDSCYSNNEVHAEGVVGGLVGSNFGVIDSSYSISNIYAESEFGVYGVGGLIGHNEGDLDSCYSNSNIFAESEEYVNCVGGLVGFNNNGNLDSCFSKGYVFGAKETGGLVGENYGNYGNIDSCYSNSNVYGTNLVGGLIGSNSGPIYFCYSTGQVFGTGSDIGGLIGESNQTITSCYWDIEISGMKTSARGIGKTTEEMMMAQTFRGWGQSGKWTIDEDNDYPHLTWEGEQGSNIVDPPRTYGGGSGDIDDPYQIWTAEQLLMIGFYYSDFNKNFMLMDDIDLNLEDPYEIVPIGKSKFPFNGIFDGAGHTISNLTYPFATDDYVGLFGYIGEVGKVTNLILEGVNIQGDSYVGGLAGYNSGEIKSCSVSGNVTGISSYIGGLVGSNVAKEHWDEYTFLSDFDDGMPTSIRIRTLSGGIVSNCYFSGETDGKEATGGLVGYNYEGTVLECGSDGIVSCIAPPGLIPAPLWGYLNSVGGLIGSSYGGSILRCYSYCDVIGKGSWFTSGSYYENVGGLIGSTSGIVSDSYATGNVTGTGSYVGGLVGYLSRNSIHYVKEDYTQTYNGNIKSCYSTGIVTGITASWIDYQSNNTLYAESIVGGIVGYLDQDGKVSSSFWDIDTSLTLKGVGSMELDPKGIEGKNTVEMQTESTFIDEGWDFVNETENGAQDSWWILEGHSYPRLFWELIPEN